MYNKMKDHIVVLDKSKNLPPELPKNLIYWHRCQTEVCNQDHISNEFLNYFYSTEFKWHDDQNGEIGRVSDQLPFFRSKPIFIDKDVQYGTKHRYVNRSEEKILKENDWPQGFVKYDIEGKIMIAKPNARSVFFNAKFESGNLRQVFKADLKKQNQRPTTPPETQLPREVDPQMLSEYNLYLKDDTNSDNSLTQWFYFGCANVKAGTVVKLNMLNLMKDDSLYSLGMQPFVYSQKRHLTGDGVKWHREGFNIEYYFNDLTIRTSNKTMDMDFDPRYVGNVQDKFKKTSTLSFSYEFKYDNDIVFFAHFAPYSYSDVFRYLCKLEMDEQARSIMRIDYICNSLGGVPMYGMTITNNIQTDYISQDEEIQLFRKFEYEDLELKPKKKKIVLPGLPGYVDPANVKKSLAEIAHDHLTISKPKNFDNTQNKLKENDKPTAVQATELQTNLGQVEEEKKEPKYKKFFFLTSRVHPGETNSQYMMQGCIEFLMSDHPIANEMRNHFVFKIIPILNPDGTIYGNYRASLLGVDLNRRWKNPSRYLHPTIYYTKSLIRFCNQLGMQHDSESGGVVFTCDMHGHSRNMDIFQYACKVFGDEMGSRLPNQIIWSIPEHATFFCPIFNPNNCKMALEKDKEATARIVLFKELGILNSYTLEATFYGSESFKKQRKPEQWIKAIDEKMQEEINLKYQISDSRTDIHIETEDLLNLGHDWLKSIHHASLRRPLGNYWFDEPRRVEEIRAKEAQIIAAQEKQLEEIRAKEREAARLAKIAEKERLKAEKAAQRAKKQLEERIARLRARGIEVDENNLGEMEKIEEEIFSEMQKKKRKRRKKKQQDYSGWDDEGKKGKRKDKSIKYEEIEEKDGTFIKFKNGRKSRVPIEIKVENKRKKNQLPQIRSPDKLRNQQQMNISEFDLANRPASFEQSVQDDISIIKQAFEVRNSRKFMSIKPGQIMGLGDHLMLQYNQLTQRQQQQQYSQPPTQMIQNQNLLGVHSRFYPKGPDNISPNPKNVGQYSFSNKNKMIEMVDQILVYNNQSTDPDTGLGSYQQNILFPQYSNVYQRNDSEKSKLNIDKGNQLNNKNGSKQAKQSPAMPLQTSKYGHSLVTTPSQQHLIEHNTHKLRQVSQLMNEIVRNNNNYGGGPLGSVERKALLSPDNSSIGHANNISRARLNQRNMAGNLGMPGISQINSSGTYSQHHNQFVSYNKTSLNDGHSGNSLQNPLQQRYYIQSITEQMLSDWNKEAQSHNLLSKDLYSGNQRAAYKDNMAPGMIAVGGGTHSRNSLLKNQQTETLKSIVSRNFSNTDSKQYNNYGHRNKKYQVVHKVVHQPSRANITIEAEDQGVFPQNLSIIDEKVIKLNGQAVTYAHGKGPGEGTSGRDPHQVYTKSVELDLGTRGLVDKQNETTPFDLEQQFQKAKKQEIERRQKDTRLQQRKHTSQRLQVLDKDDSMLKQPNQAVTKNSGTPLSCQSDQQRRSSNEYQVQDQQKSLSPLVIRKSAYPKLNFAQNTNPKATKDVTPKIGSSIVQNSPQNKGNKLQNQQSARRSRLIGSKTSIQRGLSKIYKQKQPNKRLEGKINAISSEEDLQKYLNYKRKDIELKENVYDDSSSGEDEEDDDGPSSEFNSGGEPRDGNELGSKQELNHSLDQFPPPTTKRTGEGSALDKYNYHKKENILGVSRLASPQVYQAENQQNENALIQNTQKNKYQKYEHIPDLFLENQIKLNQNKYTNFISSKSPQPGMNNQKVQQSLGFNNISSSAALNSPYPPKAKPELIKQLSLEGKVGGEYKQNFGSGQFAAKTNIDEINQQKLLRNQRAIITKPAGLHKLCNFGHKNLNRQMSNDGLGQSVVLLKNPVSTVAGGTTAIRLNNNNILKKSPQGASNLFQRQKNSMQQDGSIKNILINSGDRMNLLGSIPNDITYPKQSEIANVNMHQFSQGFPNFQNDNNQESGSINTVSNTGPGSNTKNEKVNLKYKFHSSSIQHNLAAHKNASHSNENSASNIQRQDQASSFAAPRRNEGLYDNVQANSQKQKETTNSMVDSSNMMLAPNFSMPHQNFTNNQHIANNLGGHNYLNYDKIEPKSPAAPFNDHALPGEPKSTKSHHVARDRNRVVEPWVPGGGAIRESEGKKHFQGQGPSNNNFTSNNHQQNGGAHNNVMVNQQFIKNQMHDSPRSKLFQVSNQKSEYTSFSATNQQLEYLQNIKDHQNYQSQNVSTEISPRKSPAQQRRYKLRVQQQQNESRFTQGGTVNHKREQSHEDSDQGDKNSMQPPIFRNQLLQNITSTELMPPEQTSSIEKHSTQNSKVFRAVQLQQSNNYEIKIRDSHTNQVKLPHIPQTTQGKSSMIQRGGGLSQVDSDPINQFIHYGKSRAPPNPVSSHHGPPGSHRSLEKGNQGTGATGTGLPSGVKSGGQI